MIHTNESELIEYRQKYVILGVEVTPSTISHVGPLTVTSQYNDHRFILRPIDPIIKYKPITLTEVKTNYTDICYFNNKYIIIASNGCKTSEDGIDWEEQTIYNEVDKLIYTKLCYNDDIVIAYGYHYSTSTDGETWIYQGQINGVWNSIAYDGTNFVVVGTKGTSFPPSPYLAISSDGINWTEKSISKIFTEIKYLNGEFVSIGNGIISKSSDGITWTTLPVPEIKPLRSITYTNGVYCVIVVGAPVVRHVYYSTDLISWSLSITEPVHSGPENQFENIVTLDNKFFLLGYETYGISEDGINWDFKDLGTLPYNTKKIILSMAKRVDIE